MPKPNCENLSNSASAKPSYFFLFFLFFFLVFFFSSHKNTEFTVFNI